MHRLLRRLCAERRLLCAYFRPFVPHNLKTSAIFRQKMTGPRTILPLKVLAAAISPRKEHKPAAGHPATPIIVSKPPM
jgi:hypothetical protein